MSKDRVLLPRVVMGVEAREQIVKDDGTVEDSEMTDESNPLVLYAQEFSQYFDLIAERSWRGNKRHRQHYLS